MAGRELSQYVKIWADQIGFDRCGIARAGSIGRADYLRDWLNSGQVGTMDYLRRHFRKRVDPRALLAGARSVIVVALQYHQQHLGRAGRGGPHRGRVARYAWGDDYHDVLKAKLLALADRLHDTVDSPFDVKVCVDTAPLLEREVAATAGIGWIGKNTMVINRRLGSYFVTGELITTLDLVPDDPIPDRCGTCAACLDACPTGALSSPYKMDASKCISYLTIEHRGDIPDKLAASMGDWIFGCDVCQEVCPYNRRASVTSEPRFAIRPPGPEPLLKDILAWSIEDYRARCKGSAVKRAKIDMLKRNARIALANARVQPEPPLSRLKSDEGAGRGAVE